jgi:hypothetical protein
VIPTIRDSNVGFTPAVMRELHAPSTTAWNGSSSSTQTGAIIASRAVQACAEERSATASTLAPAALKAAFLFRYHVAP